MKKQILKIALKEFKKLQPLYKGFLNVGIDNWRGFRFIFDTKDVRNCQNDCLNCQLYKLLKNEKTGIFSASLYPASEEDKKLFGPQNYLNCKTLKQYQNCYLSWLTNKCKTKKEIAEELKLVRNFKIIYSKNSKDLEKKEKLFRNVILKKLKRGEKL